MASYVHLTAGERLQIYTWQREGLPQAEIARRLGRDRSTVSRELRRNGGAGGYLPHRRSSVTMRVGTAAGDASAWRIAGCGGW